jgi:2-phosphosulfolactate phosphatase
MSITPGVHVHLLPSLIPAGRLADGLAIVLDVLRATTVMIHALAAGAEAIVPCLEVDAARTAALGFPPGRVLLAGERLGLPILGFDQGNSPEEFTKARCAGKTLVMTTTNGTRAIDAALTAERVLIAGFVNATAVVNKVLAVGPETSCVHLICSGTEGEVSWEDSLLAGWLCARFARHGMLPANDSALLVTSLAVIDPGIRQSAEMLRTLLAQGKGGRRVAEIGLAADLEAAAQIDRFEIVPEVRRDPLRIISANRPV